MPIGGSAYYDRFKKNSGTKLVPPMAPRKIQAPVAVESPSAGSIHSAVVVKPKVLVKIRPSGRVARTAVRTRLKVETLGSVPEDTAAVDEIMSQILDLAQKVHAIAGQAEAAVLRAQAAVLKAEVAVGKAEASSARAETSASKCSAAVSLAEAAVFKAESSGKRADLFAGKAGLTVSAAVNAGSSSQKAYAKPKAGGSTSQVAAMSMKLRSGMRQIEEVNEQVQGAPGSSIQSAGFKTPVERDNLASGLVSLDSDTALPRVAPFIMDDVSHGIHASNEENPIP